MKRIWEWCRAFCTQNKLEIYIGLCWLVLFNVILLARGYRGSSIDPQKAGEFGDFVGGYFGPILSLIGIVLLYKTLTHEKESSKHEAFENRYFELIKLHRENVTEIELLGSSGRKVFVLLLREWRCVLEIVRDLAQKAEQNLTQKDLLEITYYCFFFGTGPNSSRMLKSSLSKFPDMFINQVEHTLNDDVLKRQLQRDRKFAYKPLEGHQSRLGHYYRHLYQLVRYVDQNDARHSNYDYMKTIRAQLSTHEQALLLLNSLSPIGQDWWGNKLIDRYRMVQNIPREFFVNETEIPLTELFETNYFEWEEPHAVLEFACLEKPFVPQAKKTITLSRKRRVSHT